MICFTANFAGPVGTLNALGIKLIMTHINGLNIAGGFAGADSDEGASDSDTGFATLLGVSGSLTDTVHTGLTGLIAKEGYQQDADTEARNGSLFAHFNTDFMAVLLI